MEPASAGPASAPFTAASDPPASSIGLGPGVQPAATRSNNTRSRRGFTRSQTLHPAVDVGLPGAANARVIRFRFALVLLAVAGCAVPARTVPLDLDAANPDAEETPARAPLTALTAPSGEDPPAKAAAGEFVCPMHPEVRSATPGTCPKCGMKLVKKQDPAPFVCPMHPEVRSATPGKCPKCGMNLEPGGAP